MLNWTFSFLVNHKKLSLSFAVFWTIGIIIGCSMPGRDLPPIHVFDQFDKVVHFTFFMVFYILWFAALRPFTSKALTLIIIAFLFGFAIEIYQLNFVAGRSFDVWDGIADTIGAILGYLLLRKPTKTSQLASS